MYAVSAIISNPRTTTIRSTATPARLLRKTPIAMTAESAPPIFGSSPSIASVPSPAPLTLPTLTTSPPTNRNPAITQPSPGTTRLPNSWARRPDTPMTRHTFSWRAMSMTIETAIANANAAPNCTVKAVVWVMKPGPMAEVAIRNIAPSRVERVLEASLPEGAVVVDGPWVCDMGAPGNLRLRPVVRRLHRRGADGGTDVRFRLVSADRRFEWFTRQFEPSRGASRDRHRRWHRTRPGPTRRSDTGRCPGPVPRRPGGTEFG